MAKYSRLEGRSRLAGWFLNTILLKTRTGGRRTDILGVTGATYPQTAEKQVTQVTLNMPVTHSGRES